MREEIKNLGYLEQLDPVELIAFPTFLVCVFFWANYVSGKHRLKHPEYRYYTIGLIAKLLGAAAFCWVYTYYYKGGDTISYFESARAYVNLLFQEPSKFFKVYFSAPTEENMYLFSGKTGYPWGYMYFDPKTNWVIRIVTPFVLLGAKSYLLSTMMMAWVAYSGIWRLYLLFCRYYPEVRNYFVFSILLIPSAVFWGSGMLKDTLTLSASCWFIYSFYGFFIQKKNRFRNGTFLAISFFLLFSIKPYIVIALLPGAIIWNYYEKIIGISNSLLRYAMIPMILLFSVVIGYVFLVYVADFSVDKLLEEAVVKQQDLQREEYNGNSFNIGNYEPTLQGVMSVAGPAMIAGLFRPFLWESKNVVMLASGLENFIYLAILLIVLFRKKVVGIFRYIFDHPLVIFSLSYSIVFSLIIGLSTSNFGALVRFKIAFLPMFVSALIVMYHYSLRGRKYDPQTHLRK